MALTLPLPVRVVAGVLATGLDRLRTLPQDLPALPVTVAGHAVRTSMRVQQEIAELAGRGDELLSGITSRPTEHPAWARFDDEEGSDAGRTVDGTVGDPPPAADAHSGGTRSRTDGGTSGRRGRSDAGSAGAGSARRREAPSTRRTRRTGADPAAVDGWDATPADASSADAASAEGASADGAPAAPASDDAASDDAAPAGAAPAGGEAAAVGPLGPPGGPADMPGYDTLRLAQVRARLRALDAGAVARLMRYEEQGAARAGYLTLLGNRLTSLRAGAPQEPEA